MLPVEGLRGFTVDVLIQAGLSPEDAVAIVAATWFVPDPVASARPLADLPALFHALRERGLKIAIATMDHRASTEAGLATLGISAWVDAVVCADDGLPHNPWDFPGASRRRIWSGPRVERWVCRLGARSSLETR